MRNELGGPVVTVRTTDFLFAIALIAVATVLLIVVGLLA
jgi:hypothetical protein